MVPGPLPARTGLGVGLKVKPWNFSCPLHHREEMKSPTYLQPLKGIPMNKDQVKGKIKEVAGEVQEHTGKMVGSTEQEAKGHAREFEGKAQKAYGDVKENIKDTAKEVEEGAGARSSQALMLLECLQGTFKLSAPSATSSKRPVSTGRSAVRLF